MIDQDSKEIEFQDDDGVLQAEVIPPNVYDYIMRLRAELYSTAAKLGKGKNVIEDVIHGHEEAIEHLQHELGEIE